MHNLPVREMVLYKHGVGFFVREGQVDGEQVALTFRQDEINDVLKSLAVFDKTGGKVLGIHYQTPMDKEARLASSSIRLSNQTSLHDLLRDLRGRQVTLELETTPGTVENVSGRVIGLDEKAEHPTQCTVLADNGQVRVFPFDALRAVAIQDTQSEHDLSYFLDTSLSEDERRTVNVRLSEGEHEVVVYYVAPSPTWRVSYRLVAESDDDGETGKALLQGWGLFDNRLEEDLENVRVTLVAGQPISFIYELLSSHMPERRVIQDAEPSMLEIVDLVAGQMTPKPSTVERISHMSSSEKDELLTRADRMYGPKFKPMLENLINSTTISSETKEESELFKYVVNAPVSIKRGDSALVPILETQVPCCRELFYRASKMPFHPVVALRLDNSSNLTLERGPVTVIENGDYKGEAVLRFTKPGNQILLAYAVEKGIRIVEQKKKETQTKTLNIRGEYAIHEEYEVRQVTYTIENTTAKSVTITIESPVLANFELFDTPSPVVEDHHVRRWLVNTPPRAKIEFVSKERKRIERRESLRKLNYRQLQIFFENQWLSQSTFDHLSEMLNNLEIIELANVNKKNLDDERNDIYVKQEHLRKNLGALQPTGKEAALRDRLLDQLADTQNRLEAIDREIAEAQRQAEEAEEQVKAIIAGLGETG